MPKNNTKIDRHKISLGIIMGCFTMPANIKLYENFVIENMWLKNLGKSHLTFFHSVIYMTCWFTSLAK